MANSLAERPRSGVQPEATAKPHMILPRARVPQTPRHMQDGSPCTEASAPVSSLRSLPTPCGLPLLIVHPGRWEWDSSRVPWGHLVSHPCPGTGHHGGSLVTLQPFLRCVVLGYMESMVVSLALPMGGSVTSSCSLTLSEQKRKKKEIMWTEDLGLGTWLTQQVKSL